MRLASFMADLMSIKNYQRLLINKARKYQVQQLRPSKQNQTEDYRDLSSDDQREDHVELQFGASKTKLNADYFVESLLEPDQRSVEWLLSQLNPQESEKDRLLIQLITGLESQDDEQSPKPYDIQA